MSDLCPTLVSLLALGFERRPPKYHSDIVGYRFRFLDLQASHGVNQYFRAVVFLNGVVNTGRSIVQVESQIPHDLENPRMAAAWVAMALRSHLRDLGPLPRWLDQGKGDKHLVNLHYGSPAPPEHKEVASCMIDRDHARILRRRLRETIAEQPAAIDLSFAFDGRVLAVAVGDHRHEALAIGEAWSQDYRVELPPGVVPLPARFTDHWVPLVVYDSFLACGSLRLSLAIPVTVPMHPGDREPLSRSDDPPVANHGPA